LKLQQRILPTFGLRCVASMSKETIEYSSPSRIFAFSSELSRPNCRRCEIRRSGCAATVWGGSSFE
jgi:hypothetical protein